MMYHYVCTDRAHLYTLELLHESTSLLLDKLNHQGIHGKVLIWKLKLGNLERFSQRLNL